MKRFLCVCLLMFALSFPAFAGHTVAGGAPCSCGQAGCAEDYPGECPKTNSVLPSGKFPTDGTAELGIALVAILLWLRLKA